VFPSLPSTPLIAIKAFSLVFGLCIAAAPFWFASVEALPQLILLVCLGISVTGLAVFMPSRALPTWGLVFVVVLPLMATLLVAFLQNTSLVPRHAFWLQANNVLGEPLPSKIIAEGGMVFQALAPVFLLTLSVLGGILIGAGGRDSAWIFTKRLGLVGVAYAVYGIVSFMVMPDQLLWIQKRFYRESLTSTFVNRNTAALFFGVMGVLWFALALARILRLIQQRIGRLLWRDRVIQIRIILMVTCLLAVLLTGSRAGTALMMTGMAIIFLIFRRAGLIMGRRAKLTKIVISVSFLTLLVLGAGGLSERLEREGVGDAARWATYQASFDMALDHPWLGVGIGSFAPALMPYRSENMGLRGEWDRAHNILLEIAATAGFPLAVLVASTVLLLLSRLMINASKVTSPRTLALYAIGLSAGMMGVFHSIVDFSLQIPGFAMTLGVLVGIGLYQYPLKSSG
jgi:O-antigen ligase